MAATAARIPTMLPACKRATKPIPAVPLNCMSLQQLRSSLIIGEKLAIDDRHDSGVVKNLNSVVDVRLNFHIT